MCGKLCSCMNLVDDETDVCACCGESDFYIFADADVSCESCSVIINSMWDCRVLDGKAICLHCDY